MSVAVPAAVWLSSATNMQLSLANPLKASSTAVAVIDVQVGLFESAPPPHQKDAVLARINSVTARARQANVPVVFVQHDGDSGKNWLVPLSEDWRLHPSLAVRPEDTVIRKTTCDGFQGTALEAWLRDRGTKTLVLLGYATEFCVDSTVRSAASRGFRVVVICDGHTTHDSPVLSAEQIIAHHNRTWLEMDCNPGIVLTTAGEVAFGGSDSG